jgi:hypothetical protein
MPSHSGWGINFHCWNGLAAWQQRKLIERGSLNAFDPTDRARGGWCTRPAQVAIEHEDDEAPGPRFYCLPCAIAYLQQLEGEPCICPGHPAGPFDPMGQTVYCDGTCVRAQVP